MCFTTKINPTKKLKFGCEICSFPVIIKKYNCLHKFCEYCLIHIISPQNMLNKCIICINRVV
jgi:hypothetical protein